MWRRKKFNTTLTCRQLQAVQDPAGVNLSPSGDTPTRTRINSPGLVFTSKTTHSSSQWAAPIISPFTRRGHLYPSSRRGRTYSFSNTGRDIWSTSSLSAHWRILSMPIPPCNRCRTCYPKGSLIKVIVLLNSTLSLTWY